MIDFYKFEETFKLSNQTFSSEVDGGTKTMKKPETVSLLESNRLRNVGKYWQIFDWFIALTLDRKFIDGLFCSKFYSTKL